MATTPSKSVIPKLAEWSSPPTPKTVEKLYAKVRHDHATLKDELLEFMKRMLLSTNEETLRAVKLTQDEPLFVVYEYLLDAAAVLKNRAPIPVVELSSGSNSSARI